MGPTIGKREREARKARERAVAPIPKPKGALEIRVALTDDGWATVADIVHSVAEDIEKSIDTAAKSGTVRHPLNGEAIGHWRCT